MSDEITDKEIAEGLADGDTSMKAFVNEENRSYVNDELRAMGYEPEEIQAMLP